jgi:phosphohistidine phosphatase
VAAQLIIIRHAKAGEAPLDIDRPLTVRGLRDAAAIGDWLRERTGTPDRAVVSTARRAQQTWQQAAAKLSGPPEAVLDDRIYENTMNLLLGIVRETPDAIGTLVLVGHNPALGALASELDDGRGDRTARRDLRAGFPTSATAVFRMATPWAQADLGVGRLTGFAAARG